MKFFYKILQIQEVVSVKLKALIKWDGAVVVCWKVGLLVCSGICPRTFLTALYERTMQCAYWGAFHNEHDQTEKYGLLLVAKSF